MEVHHAHHPAHKKKATEYFLEFFMLFFAVLLGFFAENQREGLVERHRETQYMQSLYEDLKIDLETLKKLKSGYEYQILKLDTANIMLNSSGIDKNITATLYRVNLKTLGSRGLNLNNRTSAQLKNAGGMRLIENQEISNKISEYWQLAEYFDKYEESIAQLKLQAREKSYSIFNQKYYLNFDNGSVSDDAVLMTTDKYVLTEFNNRLNHIKNGMNNVQIRYLDKLTILVNGLLTDLKKEYKIKE